MAIAWAFGEKQAHSTWRSCSPPSSDASCFPDSISHTRATLSGELRTVIKRLPSIEMARMAPPCGSLYAAVSSPSETSQRLIDVYDCPSSRSVEPDRRNRLLLINANGATG